MLKKFVFFVFSTILVFAVTVFFRLGGHKDVLIEIKNQPEMHLMFKEHFGAYHKINEVIVAVEKIAAAHNIPCKKTFGEYLDDPRQVDERRLRSLGGCVLDVPLPAGVVIDGVSLKSFAAREWVWAQFDGAPSISPFKVYPKAEEFMFQKGLKLNGGTIEIYTVVDDQAAETEYLFPFERNSPH